MVLVRMLSKNVIASINHAGLDPINPGTAGYFATKLLLADSTGFSDSAVAACNNMIIEICSDTSLSNCKVAYIVSAQIIPCLQTITSLVGEEGYGAETLK